MIAKDFHDIGYSFSWQIIDASLVHPQSRKRVFMVGLRSGEPFAFPIINQRTYPPATSLLDTDGPFQNLSDQWWSYLVARYAAGHRGSWTYRYLGDVSPTLVTDNKDNIVVEQAGSNPRYLTIGERSRLQGFPKSFRWGHLSATQARKQIGNSVCIPLVRLLAKAVMHRVRSELSQYPL